ncbi:MAG: helix-turn-helix transcriptional regulator [Rhodoluna sp.]
MAKSDWVPTKSDKSERLLQLTCALLFARRGLSKDDIYAAIPAYADDLMNGGSKPSLDRKFERDKTDLRDSGIQIMMANPSAAPDEVKYIIAEDTFIWPKNVSFSGRQLQLLKLASQVWSRASMQSDAAQALIRLRSLGIEPAASDLIGFAPRINTHEPSFGPLTDAIDEAYRITFDYRKADGSIEKRTVEPWSLHNIDGQWLLQSFDLKKQATRNFLLRRIVSKVKPVLLDEELITFKKPDAQRMHEAEQELWALIEDQIAQLRIVKDSPAWFHFHLDDSPEATDGLLSIHYMDVHLLAEELRDFVFDIQVVKPKELAQAIKSGFEKVAADHA